MTSEGSDRTFLSFPTAEIIQLLIVIMVQNLSQLFLVCSALERFNAQEVQKGKSKYEAEGASGRIHLCRRGRGNLK